MNKKFEYVDDNPGSYFGMLVESLNESDDYESEVKDYNIYAIKKDGSSTLIKTIHGTKRDVESEINGKYNYLPKLSFVKKIEVRDADTDERVFDQSARNWEYVRSSDESDDYDMEVKDYNIYTVNKDGSRTLVKTVHGTERDVEGEINGKYSYLPKLSFVKKIEVRDADTDEKVFDESLTEDKFVSRDKMSKKDRKELDNQKRNTWGNTNPVTRVQPNKKAYDRKRDSKVVMEESKKLNESSDGWDESKLDELSEILDEIYNLQYEVKNTVRGAYTNAHSYEELGYYVHNLGSNLMDIGDEIMEMEEEDDEDED